MSIASLEGCKSPSVQVHGKTPIRPGRTISCGRLGRHFGFQSRGPKRRRVGRRVDAEGTSGRREGLQHPPDGVNGIGPGQQKRGVMRLAVSVQLRPSEVTILDTRSRQDAHDLIG